MPTRHPLLGKCTQQPTSCFRDGWSGSLRCVRLSGNKEQIPPSLESPERKCLILTADEKTALIPKPENWEAGGSLGVSP